MSLQAEIIGLASSAIGGDPRANFLSVTRTRTLNEPLARKPTRLLDRDATIIQLFSNGSLTV